MSNIHPGLILIATGILVLLLPKKIRNIVAIIGAVLSLIFTITLEKGSTIFMPFTENINLELLKVDSLSWSFALIFAIIAVISGIYAYNNTGRMEKSASLIYAGSSICVVMAGDFVTLVCFWELMAVSSCFLVWAGKTLESRRACYRYLVLHFFGGNMVLGGAMVVSTSMGLDVELLTGTGGYGCIMLLIGVLVNGAVPPLHTWVADAYPNASPAGTLYMGSYTTKVAIYALIRLFAGTQTLILVGGLMAVFGACMAFLENDLRRLLSYHIVSQLGMMVAALGTGSMVGIDGATLHAAFNILYKGVLLMGAGIIFLATGKRKITDLGGLGKKMPLVAICFLIGSLSIAGMPFFNGFASKALIMESLEEHFLGYILVTLAGVGTWLSITLKINYFVFFKENEGEEITVAKTPIYMSIAMVLGTILCLITGFFPGLAYNLTPYGTMAHPFSLEHILEYIGLFAGASIPFFILRKKMAPHDTITLDFDWFYRRPLAYFISAISVLCSRAFGKCASGYDKFIRWSEQAMNNPGKVFKHITEINEDGGEEEEKERPIGVYMLAFVAIMIIGFLAARAWI